MWDRSSVNVWGHMVSVICIGLGSQNWVIFIGFHVEGLGGETGSKVWTSFT